MGLSNSRRRLTRDFISIILSDMKDIERNEDFIRASIDFSGCEYENCRQKINHFRNIIETMHHLNLLINDYCIEQIEILRRSLEGNKPKIHFLDLIDPRATLTKKEAALFCNRSESWLQKGNHKKQFVQTKNGGVNVLSFASYLNDHKPLDYQNFIVNYNLKFSKGSSR